MQVQQTRAWELMAQRLMPSVLGRTVTGTVPRFSVVGSRGFEPHESRQGVLVGITQALLSPTLPGPCHGP